MDERDLSENAQTLVGLVPKGHTGVPTLSTSVLQMLWQERRISRADIARRSNLARSTVSEVIGGMLPTGLITEIGPGASSGGRRPILLEFQDNACTILGVEVGARHVAVALTNLRGHVLAWEHRAHPVRSDPQGTRALVGELCDAALGHKSARRLVGIGVAMPSPVGLSDPETISKMVLPEWEGVTGLSFLKKRYGVPVWVDNDANLGALAEAWWGAGVGVDNFAYIKVGTGVGSGHFIGGQIYRGSSGVAGEMGHMAIDPLGGPCMCGLRGCLATFVGAPALVERARALLARYPASPLAAGNVTIDAIEDAALGGDPLSLQLVGEAAEHLGIAIAGMINLMNPSLVVLGGGLSRLGELLVEPVRETVRQRTLISSVRAAEIRTSKLGPRSVAIGAATLVLQAALADAKLFPPATKAQSGMSA